MSKNPKSERSLAPKGRLIRNPNFAYGVWRMAYGNLLFATCYMLFTIGLNGCSKRAEIKPLPSVDEEYAKAQEDLIAKRYNRAIERFSKIIFNYPGSKYAADAQYFLAESYFLKRDYAQAIIEFEFYLNNFSLSPKMEDAHYRLVVSYVKTAPSPEKDQARTLKGKELLEEFLERFPASKYVTEIKKILAEITERLAQKELVNARLYYRLQEFNSAQNYLEYLLENYPDSFTAKEGKLLLAGCYEKNGDKNRAIRLYQEILSDTNNPTSINKKAQERLKRLNP